MTFSVDVSQVSSKIKVVPLIPATAWLISTSIDPSFIIFFTLTIKLPQSILIALSFALGDERTISVSGFSVKVVMSAKEIIPPLFSDVLIWVPTGKIFSSNLAKCQISFFKLGPHRKIFSQKFGHAPLSLKKGGPGKGKWGGTFPKFNKKFLPVGTH